MGWKTWLKNGLAIVTAPATAGMSLALMEDNAGNSILDNITGAKSAREQEKRQKQYQDETNNLSINLANTAHQREVADLKEAGLNPVLSAGGSGSATPNLGTATAVNEMPGGLMSKATEAAQIYNMAGSAKQALASANLQNTQEELQPAIAKSEIDRNKAETNKMLADTGYTKSQIEYYNKHGVFPGANISTSENASIGWGAAGGGHSTTIPVGMKGTTHGNNSARAFKNMSKEKWDNLSKAQKAMFPKNLRDLYNETYND